MKHKVLVVEDEQDTADLLKHILEREGFLVLQARDGRQASNLIGTMPPPSLILLDLVLPYVSGTELLKRFRNHPDWQHIPILIVSDDYEPDVQRTLREGATAYVMKRKGTQGLLRIVRQILPITPAPDPMVVKATTSSAPREQGAPVRRRPRRNRGNNLAA